MLKREDRRTIEHDKNKVRARAYLCDFARKNLHTYTNGS